jgi:sugar phosphate isomerase/epimerase
MTSTEIDQIAPDRLGLNIPYEWFPTSPMLKEIEASGFGWVQVPSPPASVLGDTRHCINHAAAVRRSLETTGLRAVLHAPGSLLAGDREGDRLMEATISYAAEAGCELVVYHAMALPNEPGVRDRLAEEAASLQEHAELARRLGIVIAIENMAPLYPGRETVSTVPVTLRSLVAQIGSPALRLCLDVGHANVIAGLRRTDLPHLLRPALDSVALFHVHDNLGARRLPADPGAGLDPLRLDLHLPPGRGSLPWGEIAPMLREHHAPLLLEVHPPHRPTPAELARLTAEALTPGAAPTPLASTLHGEAERPLIKER